MAERSTFFNSRVGGVLLVLFILLYFVGLHLNAKKTAKKLEPIANEFQSVSVNCASVAVVSTEGHSRVLDCGGVYDAIIAKRDDLVHARGCWNADSWNVVIARGELVTAAPIDVWCALPWGF